jgi:hypothetical protein
MPHYVRSSNSRGPTPRAPRQIGGKGESPFVQILSGIKLGQICGSHAGKIVAREPQFPRSTVK